MSDRGCPSAQSIADSQKSAMLQAKEKEIRQLPNLPLLARAWNIGHALLVAEGIGAVNAPDRGSEEGDWMGGKPTNGFSYL